MGFTVVCALLLGTTAAGSIIPPQDVQKQNQVFRRYWGTDFEWRFDALPASGSVPSHQIPYSGYIYPDNYGGTITSMRKYDRAFHMGRTPATDWEEQDNERWKAPAERRGPFRAIRRPRMEVPSWSGHCNGWAAAAIRHAEPQHSVRYRDVVFTPSDIKGLLAELYIFNDVVDLSGSGGNISAGVFHVVLANWLGRGSHGLGMEAEPGEQKWNYPVYAYNSDSVRISSQMVEVRLNLAYVRDTSREYDSAPKNYDVKHFHYVLNLDPSGRIIGGRFLRGSSLIAMLWLPLQPKQAGQPGNRAGNPYISAQRILAIWRASVPSEERERWVVVDPPSQDRYVRLEHSPSLMPLGYTVRRSGSDDSQLSQAAVPSAPPQQAEDQASSGSVWRPRTETRTSPSPSGDSAAASDEGASDEFPERASEESTETLSEAADEGPVEEASEGPAERLGVDSPLRGPEPWHRVYATWSADSPIENSQAP